MTDFGLNLQRLMVQRGLTASEVARRAGLSVRTVKGIIANRVRPQPRTLHRLSTGLGVAAGELFGDEFRRVRRSFDRETNPHVAEVLAAHPHLFAGWREEDFDELYSRFGVGGQLTAEGALRSVQAMNRTRDIQRKVAIVMETSEGELLAQIVEAFFRRVTAPPEPAESAGKSGEPDRLST